MTIEVAQCDHRRWLASVRAAAAADALNGLLLEHLDAREPGDDHAVLRAYLDLWRSEAAEFFLSAA